MCVCVCVCARHSVQKFGKIHGELNSRCLHERPIHYQMSHTRLSIWVIILPNKCSKCTWKLLQKFDLSWAVTHPSTNPAKYRLTSVIRPELVLSTWYGCTHVFYFVFCNIKVIHELLLSLIVKKKIWKKSRGIEPQMSAWVVTTLPTELFRTFNLSYYFTKNML